MEVTVVVVLQGLLLLQGRCWVAAGRPSMRPKLRAATERAALAAAHAGAGSCSSLLDG